MLYNDICESIWIFPIDSLNGLNWFLSFLNFWQILPNVYDFLAFVEQYYVWSELSL